MAAPFGSAVVLWRPKKKVRKGFRNCRRTGKGIPCPRGARAMRLHLLWIPALLLATTIRAADAETELEKGRERARQIQPLVKVLQPLHEALEAPKSGEWLHAHPEDGQTFAQYVEQAQNLPTETRRTIYVQPLGDFSAAQTEIIYLAAEFLCAYYNLRVEVQPRQGLGIIPADMQRVKTASGVPQLHIGYVLGGYLRESFPKDAALRIALTSADLERPVGRNLMSVFGMAYLYHRTAVASVYRMGNPEEDRREYRRCLLRTLKLATHEAGHALSLRHCKDTACNMNGRNSLMEMDQKPRWLCPDCVAKVVWACEVDAVRRFERLRDLCGKWGLRPEEEFFAKSARRVRERRADAARVLRTAGPEAPRVQPALLTRADPAPTMGQTPAEIKRPSASAAAPAEAPAPEATPRRRFSLMAPVLPFRDHADE